MTTQEKLEYIFNTYFDYGEPADRMYKHRLFPIFNKNCQISNQDIIDFLAKKKIEFKKGLSDYGDKRKGIFEGIKLKDISILDKPIEPTPDPAKLLDSCEGTSGGNLDADDDVDEVFNSEDLLNKEDPLKVLNPKTISNYNGLLKRLGLDNFDDVNAVRDRIFELIGDKDKKGLTKSKVQISASARPYITAVMWKIKSMKDKEDLREAYFDLLMDIDAEYKTARAKNERNEKEEGSWIVWEDVLKIRDALKKTANGKRDIKKLLVLGLYTYIPPRRLQDYVFMYYYKTRPSELPGISANVTLDMIKKKDYTVKATEPKALPDKNYYIEDEKKFVFCKYKTAKYKNGKGMGKMEIDVPLSYKRYSLNI